MDIGALLRCDVDKFYGIEYEEFPAQIAQVAMWLIDHQMNMRVSETFGEYYVRLPLRKSATIVHGNALRTEWQGLLQRDLKDLWNGEKDEAPLAFDFILGNPPFVGSKMMSDLQRADLLTVFQNMQGAGTLDYVSGWYSMAADYVAQHPHTQIGFVSTNSIVQGEQVGILWGKLLRQQGLQIYFAHQTFQWMNEARGRAAVHCIIVGYGMPEAGAKRLYLYEDIKSEPVEIIAANINAYLVDGRDVLITSRQKPLCDVPQIGIGNKPIDGGHYLFTPEEKTAFLLKEPKTEKWFRRWKGSEEFINGIERWCLWLGNCPPEELKAMPEALKRVQAVRETRLASKSPPTRKLADTPTHFHVENMPEREYLIVPKVSSERRPYIPIGFEQPTTLASDLVFIVQNASLYHFGVLTSKMHMAWVKHVGGRLKSDYRYSKDIVYNNYPWPENSSAKNIQAVEAAAQKVLDARAAYPSSSLADLYDPLTMPSVLTKAHAALDKAVDVCYRPQPFPNEAKRMEALFELYDKYTAGMFAEVKTKKNKMPKP